MFTEQQIRQIVREELNALLSPFDTTKTKLDEFGNTWLWNKWSEEYVNCGVQKHLTR